MRRTEDLILVFTESFNPGTYLRSMIGWIVWNAKFRGQKDAGKFGPKFLFRIVEIAKAVRVRKGRAIETGRVAGPVGKLMKGRSVVSGCVFERFFRREMDAVGASVVKGAIELIVFDSSAGIFENSFTSLDRLKWCPVFWLVL